MSTTNQSVSGRAADSAASVLDSFDGKRLLQDAAAAEGLNELIQKIEPLLAQRRLNRVVDLLSVAADAVDMSDAYMIEKLCKAYEEAMATAWTAGNAVRMAGARVSGTSETPSLMGLLRMARDPDVRRGLAFFLAVAGVLGKQLAYDGLDHSEA
ncbi:DUF1641 domain-containing protein [Methylocaldum sp. MU1018]|jgi:uncharacterized protein YjgD (DUF1641 family)